MSPKYVVCVCTGGLAAAPMNANVCLPFDYIHESCGRESVAAFPHYQWQGECVSTSRSRRPMIAMYQVSQARAWQAVDRDYALLTKVLGDHFYFRRALNFVCWTTNFVSCHDLLLQLLRHGMDTYSTSAHLEENKSCDTSQLRPRPRYVMAPYRSLSLL
jgi:hypothetical protein